MSVFQAGDIVQCIEGPNAGLEDGAFYRVGSVDEKGWVVLDPPLENTNVGGHSFSTRRFIPTKRTVQPSTYEQRVQAFELYVALLRANGDDGRYTPETVLAFLAP